MGLRLLRVLCAALLSAALLSSCAPASVAPLAAPRRPVAPLVPLGWKSVPTHIPGIASVTIPNRWVVSRDTTRTFLADRKPGTPYYDAALAVDTGAIQGGVLGGMDGPGLWGFTSSDYLESTGTIRGAPAKLGSIGLRHWAAVSYSVESGTVEVLLQMPSDMLAGQTPVDGASIILRSMGYRGTIPRSGH